MITFILFSNFYSALLPKAESRRPVMRTDSDMLNTPSPSSAVNHKQTTVAALVSSALREWWEEKKSKHAPDCQASDTT